MMDDVMVVMLDINNLIQKISLMMIVDEGNCSSDFSVFFQIFVQQLLTN